MKLTMMVTTEHGRLDRVITDYFDDVTRSQADKWLHAGLVTVNGRPAKASYKVAADDQIVIAAPEPTVLSAKPQNIPLDIVYEDDDVLVVNKPQGMVVHPAPGHPDGTLVNGLMYHTTLSPINGVLRPGIVHRIDKDTSGLLMVAKTATAHQSLAAQLKAKTTDREYLAIVHGNIKEATGTIDAPLVGTRRTVKSTRWCRTVATRSRISRSWNVLVATRWSSADWKRGGPTRFGCIWRTLSIR